MRILTAILLLTMIALPLHADHKARSRAAWAWATSQPQTQEAWVTASEPATTKEPLKSNNDFSRDALAEVNTYRAARGLAPFQADPLLTQAAYEAAKRRASRGIHGHLPESDFSCLPAGASADAAGCGALDDSWGWATCCAEDNYTHAGAAWVRGSDGRRYMQLFVANRGKQEQLVQPLQRSYETITPRRSSRRRG